ncbi:MAG: zinc ribbon domain-containing protein [Treponema sp.]|jgi:predicted RNA-binding Zn-ribbon protein involved in translation (DUF1610 family)|nr:zinc ribbon domain-containing protein [Treponema sp.]
MRSAQGPRSEQASPEKLRFFCDNCGIEVAREARQCPQCGKSFASILCPACGFSGPLESFKDYCPVCGYSSNSDSLGISGKKASSSGTYLLKKEPEQRSESLPMWVYIVTGLALIGTVGVLFFTFKGALGF